MDQCKSPFQHSSVNFVWKTKHPLNWTSQSYRSRFKSTLLISSQQLIKTTKVSDWFLFLSSEFVCLVHRCRVATLQSNKPNAVTFYIAFRAFDREIRWVRQANPGLSICQVRHRAQAVWVRVDNPISRRRDSNLRAKNFPSVSGLLAIWGSSHRG